MDYDTDPFLENYQLTWIFVVDNCGTFGEMDCYLGVNNVSEKNTLNVYPNPASKYVYLDREDSYVLLNAQGQEILSGKSDSIDVSGLESGLYLVVVGGEVVRLVVE